MSFGSPAAAAAVSTKLKASGVPKSIEIKHRVFTSGWWVDPRETHCEVGVLPEDDDANSGYVQRHLAECERVLISHGYKVDRVWRDDVVIIGGVSPGPVLEVRR